MCKIRGVHTGHILNFNFRTFSSRYAPFFFFDRMSFNAFKYRMKMFHSDFLKSEKI